MSDAEKIVAKLVEDDQQKARDRVEKWDKAHASFGDLSALWAKRDKLQREMGQAIALERALAHSGITREDVARFIHGSEVGQVDNYKRQTPAKVCKNIHCRIFNRPQSDDRDACQDCLGQLQTVMKPTSPSDLRTKLATHIVGVELNDGRKLWFQDPVPPRDHSWAAR